MRVIGRRRVLEALLGGIAVASSGVLWLRRQLWPLEPPVPCPTRANQDRSKKRKLSWAGRGRPHRGGPRAFLVRPGQRV